MKPPPAPLACLSALAICFTAAASAQAYSASKTSDWLEASRMAEDISFMEQVERFTAPNDRAPGVIFLFDRAGQGIGNEAGNGTGSFNDGMASGFGVSASGDAQLKLAVDRFVGAGEGVSLQSTISAVPEPATYAMLLAGLGAALFMSRRRRM